ncbi:MAG: hypothetical protein ACD_46C00563G0004 [uncultured bacterium]|nr:MAG: hypothetical protein ACD_46C00563G0004 [uncultured bacterium]
MPNYLHVVLIEVLTVSFILIPTFLGDFPFYFMLALLVIITTIELMQALLQSKNLILYPLVFIYPWAFVISLLFIYQLNNGPLYIFFLFFIVELNDSVAYVAGKFYGHKKIFPKLSPHKTYIGLYSGVAASLLLSFILGLALFNVALFNLLLIIVVALCSGIVGDMFTSFIKRSAGIKDFSNIIPTQGGILDAYDAFIFSAPFYYIAIKELVI